MFTFLLFLIYPSMKWIKIKSKHQLEETSNTKGASISKRKCERQKKSYIVCRCWNWHYYNNYNWCKVIDCYIGIKHSYPVGYCKYKNLTTSDILKGSTISDIGMFLYFRKCSSAAVASQIEGETIDGQDIVFT